MAMRRALPWILACACGHPAPPKPPPAERAVTTAADLAGSWVSSDDLDWGYRMTIGADGAIAVTIDRGKLGRCEQKGKLDAGGEAKTFTVTYAKNDCNRDYAGAQLVLKISSFTGDALAFALTGYGSEERHIYRRAPGAAPAQ
jgi:hypothetical protein